MALIVLAVAMIASAVLIGVEARNTAMQGDEWSYVYRLASQPLGPAIFDPPYGGYLVAFPMLIYAGLLHTFGMGSYLPYRVVGLGLLLAADLLFFELARRRIGGLAALLPAILLLFLGSGSEVVVVPTRMPSQVALVAGLGMLIALERRDVRGDVAACVLLLVALASHPLGVAFAAAAIVSVALRPAGERWRRWWVVVPPIALFALWWVTLHGSFPHSSYPSFGDAVSFIADSFVAVCAAASGFFRAPWDGGADFINGFSVALALVAAAAAAAMLAARRPVPATAWTALAAFAVALIAPALAPAGYLSVFRQPDAPRYLYPNALLLFLVVAELGALLRPRTRELRNALIAGGAFIFIVSLVSNVGLLVGRAHEYTRDASALRSKLAGAELAGVRSVPIAPADVDKEAAGFQLTLFLSVPRPLPPAALAAYYTVSHSFGTPAYTAEQVMGLPKDLQREAALQFRSALRLNRGSAG